MIVDIYPSVVSGDITPPASKSVLHRVIISACMSRGVSTLYNVKYSEDVLATINAFKSLGVVFEQLDDRLTINASNLVLGVEDIDVDCNESGSTIRFLIPLLSSNKDAYFRGKSSLFKRPMSIYSEIYNTRGLLFESGSEFIHTKGGLSPGKYNLRGDVSSQFISGLLFVLPTLAGDSRITIEGDLESSDYIDLTIEVLSAFKINISRIGNIFEIKGNQRYVSTDYIIDADYSQMAFFAVLGIVNNNLAIHNMNPNSKQPDRRILDVIAQMNGSFTISDTEISIKKSLTAGATVDVSQCPDIAPIIGLLASCSTGQTRIINARRLVMKESNRLLSTYETLVNFGVDVVLEDEGLLITGGKKLRGGSFESFNDHRIAMMIAIGATIADGMVTINNAEAINKSYPHFYKDLQSLGAVIKYR